MMRKTLLVVAAALVGAASVAEARPAKCFTTDDGNYACDFTSMGSDGSFRISARGKPTYTLTMMGPGVATGFVNVTGRNVALPGQFRRSPRDRACWANDATGVRICAW